MLNGGSCSAAVLPAVVLTTGTSAPDAPDLCPRLAFPSRRRDHRRSWSPTDFADPRSAAGLEQARQAAIRLAESHAKFLGA
jgi:hypothetical protein